MKLTLKPWTTEDAERLSDVFNSFRRDYTSNRRPTPYPVREAQRWLDETAKKDETEGLFYAILADEEYVGFITVERMEDVHCRDAEIGYLLKTREESKGIATWAVGEACKRAFEKMDIVRLTGYVFAANTASRKVMEKNGFVLEGVMKQALYKNGQLQDDCIYAKYR